MWRCVHGKLVTNVWEEPAPFIFRKSQKMILCVRNDDLMTVNVLWDVTLYRREISNQSVGGGLLPSFQEIKRRFCVYEMMASQEGKHQLNGTTREGQ